MTQAQTAKKRWELENAIDEEKYYKFDEAEIEAFRKLRPWKTDINHFKHVKISAVALIKMVMHSKSGLGGPTGDVEVMGVMQGYPVGDTMYVMDAIPLPCEGIEARVNASKEADEYLINHLGFSENVARPENVVGWYHSHPNFGCWLSGIDVQTQQMNQMVQDPNIAIVIDPCKTMAAGKVEIGCFRCYKNEDAERLQKEAGNKKAVGEAGMNDEKFKEFGLHAHKYYKMTHNFFKSKSDTELLDRIWNEYWTWNLSTSPLLNNQKTICDNVVNVVGKLKKLSTSSAASYGAGRGKVLQDEDFKPIQTASSKLAVEVNNGVTVEILKKWMFASNAGENPALTMKGDNEEESKVRK